MENVLLKTLRNFRMFIPNILDIQPNLTLFSDK